MESVENVDTPVGTDETVNEVETVETVDETVEESEPEVRVDPVQKRIDVLTKRARLAEEEKEYWKTQSLRREAQEAQEVPRVDNFKKPEYSDFNDLEQWQEALTQWNYVRLKQEIIRETENEKIINEHQQRVKNFMTSHPDYQEVIDGTKGMYVAPEINGSIAESEHGPEISYFLASNPDEIERINKLPPGRRLIEMGKIEERIIKKETKSVKKISSASAPVSSVNGTKTPKTGLNNVEDYATWKRLRNEEERKKRR